LEMKRDARLRGVKAEDSFGSHERAGCSWFSGNAGAWAYGQVRAGARQAIKTLRRKKTPHRLSLRQSDGAGPRH
jgi:hypothetical protein